MTAAAPISKHLGSCLCGAVRYEVHGELGALVYCHCQRCRKASGSAFNAVIPISGANFTITQGEAALNTYRSDAGFCRTFCGHCGSPIMAYRESDPDALRLRVGTLDTPVAAQVSAHIFTDSKAEWHEIHDKAPQYPERP
ncbi:MAG TPA: GFA family protein [Methylophilus sp.]|nr:GFA family protein [Methylophilus sp.]